MLRIEAQDKLMRQWRLIRDDKRQMLAAIDIMKPKDRRPNPFEVHLLHTIETLKQEAEIIKDLLYETGMERNFILGRLKELDPLFLYRQDNYQEAHEEDIGPDTSHGRERESSD